jgi:cell division protein FtsQ
VARRPTTGTDTQRSAISRSRIGLWVTVALFATVGGVFAFIRTEDYLITDPRFTLHERGFGMSGLHYTSQQQVRSVFARDIGKSVYLCPIFQRRLQLLAIDWIEDVSVSRIWPDQIAVTVRERKPVAFVDTLERDGRRRFMLVDREGVLLDPRRPVRLKLPVLTGFQQSDSPELRRERVARLENLQQDLGRAMDKISEVDVRDVENVKVTQPYEGRAVVLLLGNREFGARLRKFYENYPEIRKRSPHATVLDLRIEGSITTVAEEDSEVRNEPPPARKPRKLVARRRR